MSRTCKDGKYTSSQTVDACVMTMMIHRERSQTREGRREERGRRLGTYHGTSVYRFR